MMQAVAVELVGEWSYCPYLGSDNVAARWGRCGRDLSARGADQFFQSETGYADLGNSCTAAPKPAAGKP